MAEKVDTAYDSASTVASNEFDCPGPCRPSVRVLMVPRGATTSEQAERIDESWSPGAAKTLFIPVERASYEFCPECDYPLFWAPDIQGITEDQLTTETPLAEDETAEPVTEAAPETDATGPNGLACPACGHESRPGAKHCDQCGAELSPYGIRWWPWVAALVAILALVATVLVTIALT